MYSIIIYKLYYVIVFIIIIMNYYVDDADI